MIKIEHIAIWARDIEGLRDFYETYFGATTSAKYENTTKQFQSYFLSFQSGARIELMQNPDIQAPAAQQPDQQFMGYTHLAVSVGSKQAVDALTSRLMNNGCRQLTAPRHTGDGYYESLVLDPEGNRLEITE